MSRQKVTGDLDQEGSSGDERKWMKMGYVLEVNHPNPNPNPNHCRGLRGVMWSMKEEYVSQTGRFRESSLEERRNDLNLGQLGVC